MARKLEVQIVGDTRSLDRALGRATQSTRRFSIGMGTILKSAAVLGTVTAAFRGLSSAIAVGVNEIQEAQQVTAATNAVLESTGRVANVSAKHVDALATSISNLSGFDDEAVKHGENLLLTFRNIRNETGKGNNIFDQATLALANMSAAFKDAGEKGSLGAAGSTNFQATAIRLGKALNDPIRGLTALRRVGVQFTKDQEKLVKRLVETGRIMDAQKIILGELTAEFGGQAKAAGSTLAGQLGVLRARFKDLSGQVLSVFVPAFSRGLKVLVEFAKRLSEAKGFRAKIQIAFEAGRDIGAQAIRLASQVRDQVASALARVDWRQVGRDVGDALAKAFAGVAAFLNRVDWGNVGRVIVRGIGNFLRGVNWKAVAIGSIKLLIAAFKAQAELLLGIGEELGGALVRGIGIGLRKAKDFVIRELLSLVNRILGVTGFLGRFDPFRGVREKVQAQLRAMEGDARASSGKIQGSLNSIKGKRVNVRIQGEGAETVQRQLDALKDKTVTVNVRATTNFADVVKDVMSRAQAELQQAITKAKAIRVGAIKQFQSGADRRSLRLDQAAAAGAEATLKEIARQEAAVQAQIRIEGHTVALDRQIFELEQKRKDVNDQLAAARKDRLAEAKQAQRDAFQETLARLGVAEARAETTKSLVDNLRVANQELAVVRQQIKVEGRTADLEQQLIDIQQRRRDIQQRQKEQRASKAEARQFRALGFGPTGEELVPGLPNLRKRLGNITEAVKGTFLDTKKTANLIATIRRILAGKLGEVGADIRAKIKEILDDINQQLRDNQGKQKQITKGGVVNADAIIQNLGLSPEQARALKDRLAKVTTTGGGGAGAPRSAAPAAQVPMTVLGQGGMVINGPITVVAQDPDQFLRQLQRKARRRATQTTGPHAGNATGTTR